MSGQNEPVRSGNLRTGQLPPVRAVVWVRAGGYRIMAYRDEKGAWRCVISRRELKGVNEVEW